MTQSRPVRMPWSSRLIIVAIVVIIIVIGATIIARSVFYETPQIEYWGRVRDNKTQHPIPSAKVTLDFQDAPAIVYTDAEGVYRFPVTLNAEKMSGRVRVDAEGYQNYDRNITLSPNRLQLEDIRLEPLVSTKRLDVKANLSWQPANLQVEEGDLVVVNHISGSWSINPIWGSVGPEGHNFPLHPYNPIPNAQPGILIGKCENTENYFSLGDGSEVIIPCSGSLFLRINDDEVDDNGGSITIDLRIKKQ